MYDLLPVASGKHMVHFRKNITVMVRGVWGEVIIIVMALAFWKFTYVDQLITDWEG